MVVRGRQKPKWGGGSVRRGSGLRGLGFGAGPPESREACGCRPLSVSRADLEFLELFVAQFAAQDLADVGGRQAVAELDKLGTLVAGDVVVHVLEHLLLEIGRAHV